MNIASFDPGATTGWCIIEIDPDRLEMRPLLVESGQLDRWEGVRGILQRAELALVESFRPFPSAALSLIGDTLIAAQVIGAIQVQAQEMQVKIEMRAPGARVFFTTKRLKQYGYIPSYALGALHENRHALDAIRHALAYAHFDLKIRVLPYESEMTAMTAMTSHC